MSKYRLSYDEEDDIFFFEKKGWFGWKSLVFQFWCEDRWVITPELLNEWRTW